MMFKNALNFNLFRLFFVIYWLYIMQQCKKIQTFGNKHLYSNRPDDNGINIKAYVFTGKIILVSI